MVGRSIVRRDVGDDGQCVNIFVANASVNELSCDVNTFTLTKTLPVRHYFAGIFADFVRGGAILCCV